MLDQLIRNLGMAKEEGRQERGERRELDGGAQHQKNAFSLVF